MEIEQIENENRKIREDRSISCDQVVWILDIFERYIPADIREKGVSQKRKMMSYGMLYELMDVANLYFMDESARLNGTPQPARTYPKEETIGE